MNTISTVATQSSILEQVVKPDRPDLPQEAARAILALRFEANAIERMTDLAQRNSEGTLSAAEREEMDIYLRVGNLLNLLQAKARLSLKPGT